MKIIYFLGGIFVLALALLSCQKKIEKEYSWAYPVAGDWTLKATYDDEVEGPFEVKVYNTSFGQDSIWIDDYAGNFAGLKFKAKVDMASKTFQTSGSKNIATGSFANDVVKITEGKIVNNDSIYFKMELGKLPGTVFTISGHRTTSYDEYMGH